jgi:predicted permease
MSRWAAEVRARLSSLHLSPTREAEIVDELSQHLDDRYRELLAGGTSPDEAARLTLAEFRSGDALAQHMAPLRQSHAPTPVTAAAPTGRWVSDLLQDLRYASRMFRKQPGFTATAVLTLALGIGATAAIFSVVYGVLLKPLPFHEPERLVSLLHTVPDGGRNHGPATYFTYLDNQRAFEGVGAWETNEVSLTGRGDPEHVDVLSVSDATLPLLRVQPILGRLFNAADDTPGTPLRAVLAHGYWQRRFGGDAHVVGQSLSIDGVPAEIIGVLPASFRFLSKTTPALLLPMQVDRARAGFIEFDFQVLARLKPGVTLPQANADVGRMIPLLPQPFARLQMQPHVQPLVDSVTGDVGHILWILLAAAGVVLLIACGNVANLFLIRAEGRQQELAMRAALGASRGRIARVLLTESVLVALAGGALAVAFAQPALDVLQQVAPVHLPRVEEIGIDPNVLLFTVGISVLSGVVFGLFAVARFGTPGISALKEGGRSSSDGPARLRARNALVVAQVSLALVLMVVSGLMIRTFIALRQVQPGFTQPSDVQTFRLDVPEGVVADPREAARTYERIAERLASVPGVSSVGLSSSITMDGEDNGNSVDVEDFPVPDGQLSPLWRFKSFGPGYFETMGNRVVAGRSVTWAEIHEERPVILISAALAREYWKEPSKALGKRVRASSRLPWREIVGIVGDERDDGLNHPATKIVYWPLLNDSYEWRALAFAVRSTRAGDASFLREVQQAVWSVNPNLPLATVQTLEEIQAHSMAQTSFAMAILGIAASVALLLGIVGIYGAIAYIATERTREIGIRIALGAQTGDVRRLFLRQGFWLTATGIALGVLVALALSRVMSALLFGVGPADPLTYVVVSAALGAVALLATYLPARRASRVDPIVALRADAM